MSIAIIIADVAWLGHAALLREALRLWVVSENIDRPADAVLVLGGGVDFLPLAAADLYKRGLAKRILLSNSGGNPSMALGREYLNANLNRAKLIKLGVPPSAIETVGANLSNTYEEAAALVWTKVNHATGLIVPAQLFHSRRVQWIFRREFAAEQIEVYVIGVPQGNYDASKWWQSWQGFSSFANEAAKYLFYRLRYW
ncbi:MAG: YdcF family protein [Pseudolabrys sp.]